MRKLLGRILLAALLGCGQSIVAADAAPDFKEVFDIIRQNAAGVTEGDLNRAAVQGLLAELSSHAWLVETGRTAQAATTNGAPLASTAIFDEHYGYLRVAEVTEGLPKNFAEALGKLRETNKLRGLVVDLRFAKGTNYAAAAKVADLFLASDQPLLDWGTGSARSTDKTNAFRAPVAVLVNRHTAGAAEALGAALRHTDSALVIGTNTAGQASITKDFTLRGGEVLRVAVAPIKVGGEAVSRLKPDIQVSVSAEDERVYLADAYKLMPRPGVTNTNAIASLSVTNKPRRRINEAELVRMMREGESPDEETAAAARLEPPKPTVTDPALARAIDLLKALAIVRGTRS